MIFIILNVKVKAILQKKELDFFLLTLFTHSSAAEKHFFMITITYFSGTICLNKWL